MRLTRRQAEISLILHANVSFSVSSAAHAVRGGRCGCPARGRCRNAQGLDYSQCESPAFQVGGEQDATALWNGDRRVYVFRTQTPAGIRFRVVGDIVELSLDRFPSLFRSAGQYLEGVTEVTVDAREIIVAMPLRLSGGVLRLRGDRVSFPFEGLVSFVSTPDKQNQLLEITTRELDLSSARSTPFVFATQEWDQPANQAGWNAPGKPQRAIEITAGSVKPRAEVLAPAGAGQEAASMLAKMSLDARYVTANLRDRWSLAYRVSIGEPAALRYVSLLRDTLEWPDATAIKLQRIFSQRPYDRNMKEFAENAAARFAPDFEGRKSKVAVMGLGRVAAASRSDVDLFGLNEYATPMTSASERIKHYGDMLSLLFGPNEDGKAGLIKQWDEQAAHAAANTGVNAAGVKDLQDEAQRKRTAAGALSDRINSEHLAIESVENEISTLDAQIASRQEELKHEWQKEQDKRQQEGKNIQVAQAVATVGSIAFPAAAPFLAGASGALAMASTFNDPNASAAERFTKIAEIAQRHAAIVDLSVQVRKDWNTVRDGFGGAVAYARKRGAVSEAEKKKFEDWKTAAENVKAKSAALLKGLEPADQPAKLEFPTENAEKDARVLGFMGKRNASVKRQQVLNSELLGMREEYDRTVNEILEAEAVIAELLTLNLSNDEERQRYRQLSDWARRSLMRDLAREAVLLRRSLVYATGQTVDLPVEALMSAEGDQAESYADFKIDPGQIDETFTRERERRAAVYGLLKKRASQAYEGLKSSNRWNIPTPISFTADSGHLVGDPEFVAARKRFLAELNTEIAGSIAGVKGRHLVRIPFQPDLTSATEGAIVLGVNLARLEFEDGTAPDGQINLTVEHPRFGALWRANTCTFVQDVSTEASSPAPKLGDQAWPLAVPADVTTDWQKKIDFANRLFRIQDAMFPFYSVYYLAVEVPVSAEWSAPPKVKSIELQFVAARPS